jgi:methionine synthase II (cobalamin-independent)
VVDSRTTYLEDIALLVSRVERVVERTGVKTLTLAPSADLRYIPRVSADEKLELLGRLRARVRHGTDSPKAKPPVRRGSK